MTPRQQDIRKTLRSIFERLGIPLSTAEDATIQRELEWLIQRQCEVSGD